MTDTPFVVAAYVLVLGALAGYGFALGRRTAAARRLAELVRRDRERGAPAPDIAGPVVAGAPSEVRR